MFKIKYLITVLIVVLSASTYINAKQITTLTSTKDSIVISGIIKGEDSKPLKDVSVSIKGYLQAHVITDENGLFKIKSPSKYEWLSITPVGDYKKRLIFQNGKEYFEIHLTTNDLESEDDPLLDVFGSKLAKNVVSSTQSFQPKQYHFPVQTVDQLLQTNIAGSFSVGHSGMPGSGAVNYIRGIKSMNTNNQPLYVIDGVPIESAGLFTSLLEGNNNNPLSFLDPNDITAITVLKDNSAGYVYGVRGSNGVVLIETLKPSEVRTIIDFSFRTGISMTPVEIPQLNSNQYKLLANELSLSSNNYEEDLPNLYPGLYVNKNDANFASYNNNTNWQKEIFKNATINDYYLRILGGDQIARYGLSIGYVNHNSIIKNTNYDRFNVRFVGAFSLFSWLRLNVTSNLSQSESELRESALAIETSPILTALSKTPIMSPYDFDSNGNQLQTYSAVDELGISNPLAIINKLNSSNKNYRILTSVNLEADIVRNLKFRSLLGLNVNSIKERAFFPNHGMALYYRDEAYNVSKSLSNKLLSINNDNNFIYQTEIKKQHKLALTAGLRINMNTLENDWAIAKNSNLNDEYQSLQSGVSYLRELGGDNRTWNRMAMYSNANYIFRDKYIVNAGLALENSSRIGVESTTNNTSGNLIAIGNVPFGLFYTLGGAWRISEEKFLSTTSWLEELKLRLTWGTSGNDDIGDKDALRYYMPILYRETTGMLPGNNSDRRLQFETVSQLNVGFDLSVLNNRFKLSADYYKSTSSDLLVYQDQNYYLGFSNVASNNGSLTNNGWEVNMFTRLLSKNKFNWDLNLNLSGFENQVVDFVDGQIITRFTGGEFISKNGESVLNFYGYQFEGIYSTAAEAQKAGMVNSKGISYGAGDAKFKDISGPDQMPDGKINNYDKTIIGSPIPDIYGTVSTRLSYGNWMLRAGIQFVNGNQVFNYLRSQNENMVDLSNQSKSVLNRWYYEGHQTDVPRAVWGDPVGNSSFSTRWIEDGSYLRLKNLTVAYKVDSKILFFRDAEIFITGTNLFTLTKYLSYDPEFSNSYNTMEQGIDYGQTPFTKQYMIGIKVGL